MKLPGMVAGTRPCLFLIALLVLLAWALRAWAGPTLSPRPMKAFTPAELDRFYAMERKQKRYIRAVLIASAIYERNGCDPWLAELTARYALARHLPVSLVAADVIVESSCRPEAVSSKGAVGLLQVMPVIWGRRFHVKRRDLFDPERNLQVGTTLLAYHIHRYGLRLGIVRYCGVGDEAEEYADRVLEIARVRAR